jgi:hypothetical protein
VQQDPGRRGEGGGVVASKGFHADEELSKKGWHDSERHTLKGVAEEGSGVGSSSGPRRGRWMGGGGVPARRSQADPGGAVGGGSTRSRWRWPGEQGVTPYVTKTLIRVINNQLGDVASLNQKMDFQIKV